ncbi:HofP DNA utilization family protein [Enterobacter sp. Bisph1]|uniref:HofP DNA utilization family protein n=1 Tax=Enterobacter sp. Bisph1 TaxID=1274399 RepID=UPI00057BE592|nr:HofP DNA utilization family protein [Enterobacter sp. Bisph1]
MRTKRLLLAGLLCLLLSGMRDPFQPPLDTCRLSQLSHWQFHGAVIGEHTIGFLRDDAGRWYRVAPGETLTSGWRVIAINQNELVIEIGKECTPAQWRWQRQGTQNAKMDSNNAAF